MEQKIKCRVIQAVSHFIWWTNKLNYTVKDHITWKITKLAKDLPNINHASTGLRIGVHYQHATLKRWEWSWDDDRDRALAKGLAYKNVLLFFFSL